jgi:ubiquinone biosynthesis protein COQ4
MMTAMVWKSPRDEAEAARILEAGGWFTRAVIALRAGAALARDPNDTEQVFLLARALDSDSLPRMRRRLEGSADGRALLRDRPAIDRASVDFDALRALGADTLGGAYVRMMDANGLTPDIFKAPPAVEPDLAYVAQRIRQTHDLWHVVTGLATDIPGEVALQAFTHAQLGQRFSRAIVLHGLLIFGLRYPRMFGLVRRWHRAGRRMPYLLAVRWEELWDRPLSEVRAHLGLPNAVS